MKKFVFVVLMAIGLSGCETMPYELTTRADRASMTQDQMIAQENERRLAGRLDALESEIGRIRNDLDALRSRLDSRCSAIEQKSEADKREMVDRLSGELNKLMKQASTARPAPRPSQGIEHTVKPGETLYIISKAYGVDSKTIINLNNIPDPNRLSAGQKLFIPQ